MLRKLRIQSLFIVAILVKGVSAFGTLLIEGGLDNLLFWLFAVVIPLGTMTAYIYAGVNREDRRLTDEKFADSCYYLGFLFTIVSITVSLIDLPDVGVNLNQIAVRFGVGMLSTVFGLATRVWLINFKVESNDAVVAAEDALIRGAETFADKLGATAESFARLESQVNQSANNIVENINIRLEKMVADHSVQLQAQQKAYLEQLDGFSSAALVQIDAAGKAIKESSERVNAGVGEVISKFKEELGKYSDNLRSRLDQTALPVDFFVEQVTPAAEKLTTQLDAFSLKVEASAENVVATTDAISQALMGMNRRTNGAAKALAQLEEISEQNLNLVNQVGALVAPLRQLAEQLRPVVELAPLGASVVQALDGLQSEVQAIRGQMTQDITSLRELSRDETALIEKTVNNLPNLVAETARSISASTTENFAQYHGQIMELVEEIRRTTEFLTLRGETPDDGNSPGRNGGS